MLGTNFHIHVLQTLLFIGPTVDMQINKENGDLSDNMATTVRRRFHSRHGNLVLLTNNSRTASRNEPRQEFNNGLVISKTVLKDNEIFEVSIDKKVGERECFVLLGLVFALLSRT